MTAHFNLLSTRHGEFRASAILKVGLALVWALCILTFLAMISMMGQVRNKVVLQQPVVDMLYAFNPVREAAAACHRGGVPLAQCMGVAVLMPQSTAKISYQLTARGELIGIDYPHHVMVLLSPQVAGNELLWVCRGQPVATTVKGCKPDMPSM